MTKYKKTKKQGQYLAFIHYYSKVNNIPPAESDIQRYFGVTPPTVHSMLMRLEKMGLISKVAGKPRTIKVLVPPDKIPDFP